MHQQKIVFLFYAIAVDATNTGQDDGSKDFEAKKTNSRYLIR